MEIDYEIDVPRDALHGDWVNLALEADGVLMGRARLQLFRPGVDPLERRRAPPLRAGDGTGCGTAAWRRRTPKAGRNLEIVIRNNSPQIQTYQVEARATA